MGCRSAEDGALDVLLRPWRCPEAKLEGNLAAKVAQDGLRRGQERPRWPEKGSQTYAPRIYPMIAARFGGHLGAILGNLGASGADHGVSWCESSLPYAGQSNQADEACLSRAETQLIEPSLGVYAYRENQPEPIVRP